MGEPTLEQRVLGVLAAEPGDAGSVAAALGIDPDHAQAVLTWLAELRKLHRVAGLYYAVGVRST